MRSATAILCLMLATPLGAVAQQPTPAPQPPSAAPPANDGTDLILEGLMKQFAPALRQLGEALGDISGYEAPEVLPNGDILIRKRAAPPGGADSKNSVDL